MASRGANARPFRRAALLASALFGVFVALGTSTAVAGTVSYDGDAVVFTGGDNDGHELQFRLSGGDDDIIDSEPITSAPSDCTFMTPTRVVCPGSPDVRVELGGGSDDVYFSSGSDYDGDCFLSYTLNLGGGDNYVEMNDDCTGAATATLTAGSGNDSFRFGSPSTNMNIVAGAGNDSTYNGQSGQGDDVIHGGEGDDTLYGDLGNDEVYGEGGDDNLGGGEGNDVEDGGPGDDDINYDGIDPRFGAPDPGADVLRGGGGTDLLRLDSDTVGMAISIDGKANDGRPGEGDNVGSDIEQINGTLFADLFIGSAGADGFNGSAGNDEIHGAGGDVDLRGSDSEDRVFGDAGDDFVEGGYDADRVDGGPGNDGIFGDIAGCSASCIPDEDELFARDGEPDVVDCGGPGSAQVDGLDTVQGGCVFVDRPPGGGDGGGGGGGGGGTGAAPAKASFAGSRRSIKVSRRGRFNYSFRARARLSGKAVFRSAKKVRISRRARVKLAAKSFTVPGTGRVKLKMKLSRKKLAILRRNKRIKTRVTVTLKNAAGRSSVASTTVTLKRPAPR